MKLLHFICKCALWRQSDNHCSFQRSYLLLGGRFPVSVRKIVTLAGKARTKLDVSLNNLKNAQQMKDSCPMGKRAQWRSFELADDEVTRWR